MSVLPDHRIEELSRKSRMIEPFAPGKPRKGRISYGISSYGYDFRLANEFRIPEFEGVKCLDPKKMNQLRFRDYSGSSCLIPANSFILGRSLEYFRIPRDILVLCQGKSTYARCGLIVNITPLEPEWEGYITISLINSAPVPLRVHAGEGIGQLVLTGAAEECAVSYKDRKGKYQAQKKIQTSKV